MATQFQKDQIVRLNKAIPQGPVVKLRMDDDGKFFYLVEWTNDEGVKHQRWFAEDELVAA